MKYDSATIDVTMPNGTIETIDLEAADSLGALDDCLHELAGLDDDAPATGLHLEYVTTNPQGFAVHLFREPHKDAGFVETVANYDDILAEWSAETDSDRREAMGEYLDDMGADDLSDFDEAYQGQYSSGAAFAEDIAKGLGVIPTENTWICIDWEQTWKGGLRHDYHITDSGHVFRNL